MLSDSERELYDAGLNDLKVLHQIVREFRRIWSGAVSGLWYFNRQVRIQEFVKSRCKKIGLVYPDNQVREQQIAKAAYEEEALAFYRMEAFYESKHNLVYNSHPMWHSVYKHQARNLQSYITSYIETQHIVNDARRLGILMTIRDEEKREYLLQEQISKESADLREFANCVDELNLKCIGEKLNLGTNN